MNIFDSLCLIHIIVWLFVLFAFLDKKTAYYNVYYIIPLIYIIHILPFHVLVKMKQELHPDTWKNDEELILKKLVIPEHFVNLQKKLEQKCFCSPISPQGMLIFGLITSILTLYPKCSDKN